MALGDRLARARQEQGISLEEVERRTHIPRRYLEALEADAYGVMPAPVYARGFLRTYARFLGLDDEELLSLSPASELQTGILPIPTRQSSINLWAVAALAFSLGLLLWAAFTLRLYQVVDEAAGAVLDEFRSQPEVTPVPTETAPAAPRLDCETLRNATSLTPEETEWFNENCLEPTPEPTPPAPQPPERTTCEEIRGTEYRSGVERAFFLENCLTPPAG